jgi:hypothetical protein
VEGGAKKYKKIDKKRLMRILFVGDCTVLMWAAFPKNLEYSCLLLPGELTTIPPGAEVGW